MNDAIKKFEAQVRKTQRMIDALSTVEFTDSSSVTVMSLPIMKAIDRCYTLVNRLAGQDGQDERCDAIWCLSAAASEARIALQVRVETYRGARCAALTLEIARRVNARPY
jgi:hypothetical protein